MKQFCLCQCFLRCYFLRYVRKYRKKNLQGKHKDDIMKYTHVVWDWNGTLFDDIDFSIECVNSLLKKYGLNTLTREKYYEVFGFPISDYYKRVGFDFNKTPYDVLAKEYMDKYMPGSYFCPLREGAQAAIDKLNSMGCKNIVLSASKKDYLLSQMKHTGIKNIDAVYGIGNIHAAGKQELASRVRKEYKDAKMLFIGDTPHDMLAAKAANADWVFVSGGHKAADELKKYGAVFDHLAEVVKYIEGK